MNRGDILLVDDDPDLLKLISLRLTSAGYRVRTADSGETALATIAVERPATVITDLRNNTYYATLHLTVDGAPMELDSRPSDAIALAIRAQAPVYAEDRVFEKSDRLPWAPAGPGERI